MAEPLGWNNVERFLKPGLCNTKEQKGCFSISSKGGAFRVLESRLCRYEPPKIGTRYGNEQVRSEFRAPCVSFRSCFRKAFEIVIRSRLKLKELIARHIRVERPSDEAAPRNLIIAVRRRPKGCTV